MQSIDLLIIGAGPAGISTALHLLNHDPGWSDRMLILEKAVHPRPKLCGGGVTRFGLDILRRLGLPMPLPLPQARVQEARLKYANRTVFVRNNPQFVVYARAELDAFLVEAVRRRGAVIQEDSPVLSLSFDETGVTAATPHASFRARVVVGADGSTGLARRMANGRVIAGRVARLLEVVTPAVEAAPQFQERYAVFDFTPARSDLQGYAWDFPTRVNGLPFFNRGVYDSRVDRGRRRARLPMLLDAALRGWDDHPERVQVGGHPIHRFSPRNRFSRPRLVLVGDAAGADPLFGEGIGPALGYGQVAAEAILQAFTRSDFNFHHYRRQVLLSPVGRYLLLRWAAAWWSYRLSGERWFMHVMWSLGKWMAALSPEGEPL